jgi:16S rRNA (adenine1518-N6/adenine1519-N6)-dimethyltransferase
VKSIVLKATRVDHQFKCDPKLLHKVVKTAFNQRRKVLSNSLSSILPKETLNQSQFANLRPENLTTEDFESLSSFIEGHVSN